MRIFLPLLISIAALSNQALAADLPTRKPAPSLPPPPAFSWTGFYAGVDVGGSLGNVDFHNNSFNTGPLTGGVIGPRPPSFNYASTGVLGGIEGGYNYQSGMFVGGVEADGGLSSQGRSLTRLTLPSAALIAAYPGATVVPVSLAIKQSSLFFGTARLRAGIAPIDRLLIFATGGVAVSDDKFATSQQFVGFGESSASKSITAVAPVLGGGVEYAIASNWSLKAEYLHAWMPDITVAYPPAPVSQRRHTFDEDMNIFRVGLNFHL